MVSLSVSVLAEGLYFPFGRRPFRFTVIMPAAPSEKP
jgi:hypothetical protein